MALGGDDGSPLWNERDGTIEEGEALLGGGRPTAERVSWHVKSS